MNLLCSEPILINLEKESEVVVWTKVVEFEKMNNFHIQRFFLLSPSSASLPTPLCASAACPPNLARRTPAPSAALPLPPVLLTPLAAAHSPAFLLQSKAIRAAAPPFPFPPPQEQASRLAPAARRFSHSGHFPLWFEAVVSPPHTLLYPPQPAPFLFPTGTELLTSSHGGSNGRPWPTSFHPFARAWSHQNRIPLLSSLSPCPRLREWRPGPPIWLSSVSSCPLSWRPGIPRSNWNNCRYLFAKFVTHRNSAAQDLLQKLVANFENA